MNLERVVFGFFIFLALALNLVFVVGEMQNPAHHNVWILTFAILVNLVATGLKLGDRSQIGALLLAAGLVADLLLISARVVWVVEVSGVVNSPSPEAMVGIVSLACGALLANFLTVVMLTGDTLLSRR